MYKVLSRMLIVALALVITACSMGTPVPTATPNPTNTPVLPTSTITPSPTLTPTPIPMLSVATAVDCYAGPTMQFDKVASLEANAQIRIEGASEDGTFWIVATEDGKECWLPKDSATVTTGEVSSLPQIIPPATPTLGPPAAPSESTVQITCNKRPFYNTGRLRLEPESIITWKDNANDEDGYIIYKDGSEVKRLPANSTQYKDGVWIKGFPATYFGPLVVYGIAAFNSLGVSTILQVPVQISCS